MNHREYQTVMLAGLLHDFGKFLIKPMGKSKEHEQAGIEYWQTHAKQFANKTDIDIGLFVSLIGKQNDTPLWHLVKRADGIASGEREESPPGKEVEDALNPQYYSLDGVFHYVDLQRGDLPKKRRYAHIPLSLEEPNSIFPTQTELPKTPEDARRIEEDIANLKTQFDRAVDALMQALPDPPDNSARQANTERFYGGLVTLLQRYVWCLPDDVKQKREEDPRDISLFDHSRLVSAAAACLYAYHDTHQSLADVAAINKKDDAQFLLIGGDLSGIQNYLYEIATIGAGGAAKRLRARSFYLTALVEVIAQRALRELVPGFSLPHTCKIISAGGRFALLVPNWAQAMERLGALETSVNDWLCREFQGELAFSFAAIPLTGADFVVERKQGTLPSVITQKLTELDDALAQRKARKLQSVLVQNGQWLTNRFENPWPSTGEVSTCQSCRKIPARKTESESGAPLCDHCDQDKKFGRKLANAQWVAYFRGDLGASDNVLRFFDNTDICSLAVYADLPTHFSSAPLLVERISPPTRTTQEVLLQVNAPVVEHFIANYVPHENGEILDFEELANRSDGEPLLGVLKVDVDRLGMIFAMGLANASLSRLATLSRMVDLFFGGWINATLATQFKDCYTVYSGGDDLLLVGPWTTIVNLSQVIAEKFAAYVGHNPNVTLSAGIAVTKPKFPIAKSSNLADEWMKKAKQERNALHLFGVTAKWDSEMTRLLGAFAETVSPSPSIIKPSPADAQSGYGVFLHRQSQKDGDLHGKRGFLYRLLRYSTMCARYFDPHAKRKHPRDLLYSSHLVYDIARNVRRMEGDRITNKEVVEKLEHLAYDTGRPMMQKLRLPLTWALLKLRGE